MNAETTKTVPDDLISVSRAAEILADSSLSAVYRWIKRGKLRAWEIAGARLLVSEADVRALIVPVVPDAPAELPRTQSQMAAAREQALQNLRQKGWPV